MRNLKEYIVEGIFDIDDNIDNIDKHQIEQFLKENFKCRYKISDKPNTNGKYEVSSIGGVIVGNKKITALTNGLFIWTNVDGTFSCYDCSSLTSLEGAPKEVSEDFDCSYCYSLKSLEGAPEKVGGNFDCDHCDSLTSLKGSPKKVGGYFSCRECGIKFTEEDVTKLSKVVGKIYV